MVIPLIFPKVPQSSLGSPVTPSPLRTLQSWRGKFSAKCCRPFLGGTLNFGERKVGTKSPVLSRGYFTPLIGVITDNFQLQLKPVNFVRAIFTSLHLHCTLWR